MRIWAMSNTAMDDTTMSDTTMSDAATGDAALRDDALRIDALTVRYGTFPALQAVSLGLRRGEAVALIGPNGAGKTTLLNAISGFLKPSAGRIALYGAPIGGKPPHAVVRCGVLQVPQDRALFGDLSVLDNLKLGALTCREDYARNLEHVFACFPRLKERQNQAARTLSGGEQQMLAIGRALMASPRVLLLDEPSAGLAPMFLREIGVMLAGLKQSRDIAIVLVEQNIGFAAEIADRFLLLRDGRIAGEERVDTLRAKTGPAALPYF
jgi:branched-chain amino acid transport system ATP-binding protein